MEDDETDEPGERPESDSAPLAWVFALPSVSVRTRSFARDAPAVNSSINDSDEGGVVVVAVPLRGGRSFFLTARAAFRGRSFL